MLSEQLAGAMRLLPPVLRQINVSPTREPVLQVPNALTVA